jgi:hypothetical protein
MSSIALIIAVFCSTIFSSGNPVMIYHALFALLLPHGPVSRRTRPAGPHILQQWQLLLDRGHYTFPENVILAASAFFHAVRQLPETSCSQKRLFYAAAGLHLAVIPFTLMFVTPVNVELLQRAARARKGVAEFEECIGDGSQDALGHGFDQMVGDGWCYPSCVFAGGNDHSCS